MKFEISMLLVGLVIAFVAGLFTGIGSVGRHTWDQIDTHVKGEIQSLICYPEGCSVLVKYPDRTAKWVWMEVTNAHR